MNRFFNITIRGLTLASKFFLILFLAAFLEPEDLGLYGLLVATIAYAIYPLGFDFYTYSTRELIKFERSSWGRVIRDQGVLHLALYAAVIPLMIFIFVAGLLPWYLFGWFFVLLILEHINQELMRLLIAMSEQLTASIILFLRSGSWAIIITIWMLFEPSMRTLESVLAAWVCGGSIALILAFYRLYCLNIKLESVRVDWHWIIRGLKVAVPFLLATLAIRAVFTIDRYWFEELRGLDVLGAYVLFMGMANALLAFLDAGVFSFSYPKLIESYNKKEYSVFRLGLKNMVMQTLFITVIFTVISVFAVEPFLKLIDKPFYIENLDIFYWSIGVLILYSVSSIPHYGLYAQGYDKSIVFSHFLALFVFLLVTRFLSDIYQDKAVFMGLVSTFTVLLIWKTWAFYRLTPRQYRSSVTAEAP